MADLKFGVEGLRNTTPSGLKIAYRTLMGLLFIWTAFKAQFPEVPDETADMISRILDFGTPILYGVSQMFGLKQPE